MELPTVAYLGMGLVGVGIYLLWATRIRKRRCVQCGVKLGTLGKHYCHDCLSRKVQKEILECERCGKKDNLQQFCPTCFRLYVAASHEEELKTLCEMASRPTQREEVKNSENMPNLFIRRT